MPLAVYVLKHELYQHTRRNKNNQNDIEQVPYVKFSAFRQICNLPSIHKPQPEINLFNNRVNCFFASVQFNFDKISYDTRRNSNLYHVCSKKISNIYHPCDFKNKSSFLWNTVFSHIHSALYMYIIMMVMCVHVHGHALTSKYCIIFLL